MNTSEKFCLKWDFFQENINTAIGSLRNDEEFNDVTLACEDGRQIKAHKVILASSSPLFQTILRKNSHSHPLIYMRGMKHDDLLAIVDFLYCGKTNIQQDQLEGFLSIAEELSLKGLTGGGNDTETDEDLDIKASTMKKPGATQKKHDFMTQPLDQAHSTEKKLDVSQKTVALAHYNFLEEFQGLDEKVKSLMTFSKLETRESGKKDKVYKCNVCGKEGQQTQMRDHIEANHMEGISIPCNLCKQTFR